MKSSGKPLRFGQYTLDPRNRVLLRDGVPVELGSRYLDALLLLVGSAGRLVTKEHMHQEVWRGVPVTDEALTQCIRCVRRALGDEAVNPRFIETVPKHGYRFIAPVALDDDAGQIREGDPANAPWLMLTGGGGIGGALAGAIIGLIYGLGLARAGQTPGAGLSTTIVIACCGALAGLFSGLAIAGGVATGERFTTLRKARWIVGGGVGGLIAGVVLNMLSRDVIALMFGRRVVDLAGGLEGLMLGVAIGAAFSWLRTANKGGAGIWLLIAGGGGVIGFALPLMGGTLFAGSLHSVAASVPGSALPSISLPLSKPLAFALGGAFEGALFTAGVTLGLTWMSAGTAAGTWRARRHFL